MANIEQTRGIWGTKIGFILAASGSAIGLGNIWRFPYVVGENGGAVFVLIYIFFIIAIGLPVMIAELTIGRNTQKNPVGAFKKLFPDSWWKLVGGLCIVSATVGLSFYAVIAGFMIGYFFKIISGDFGLTMTALETEQIFSQFTSNPYYSIGLIFVFIMLTVLIVRGGVSAGIERWSKILMPVLFILLIILAIRAISLDGASKGLVFYLKPDPSKITATTFIQALGQALFSLSLGLGGMITYGSYISKKDYLLTSAGSVCFFDTLIAILAGLIIFPALFAMGLDPESGVGLVFIVLPSIFAKIPAGMVFGAGIFLLISLAALTSAIAILEIPVAYLVDERKWSRRKATSYAGTVIFVLSVPSALSMGASAWFSNLPFLNMPFINLMITIFVIYALPIGAFFFAIFVGYKWGIKPAISEIEQHGNIFKFKHIWIFLIRFICPIAIAIILGYIILGGEI